MIRGQRLSSVSLAFLSMLTLALQGHAQMSLPPGFGASPISPELKRPVAMAFAPDGRLFVAEQRGTVEVFENGQKIARFIDLRDEVDYGADLGLLGLALDPDFPQKPFVYLLYTVDPLPGQPNEPPASGTFARLTRYRGSAASGGNVANLNSRRVLIGGEPPNGFPACFSAHTIADRHFAPDKTLLVSGGDGATYELADGGGNTPDCFAEGWFGLEQDIGSFRAQSLDSLDGKILRIKRGSGKGVSTNPYYDGDP